MLSIFDVDVACRIRRVQDLGRGQGGTMISVNQTLLCREDPLVMMNCLKSAKQAEELDRVAVARDKLTQ